MILEKSIQKIPYGGDYNPEQWSRETWQEDMRLLKLAGINTVTLNVFNWSSLQPAEDVFDFAELDQIVDLVTQNQMNICMATSTAAHPAWMAKRYPDILRTDFSGIKRKYGARHNSCPNSPTYQKFSQALVFKLAEHYQNQQNIVAWHVNNEYGGVCYCENCEKTFRKWLQNKYGTLEQLNRVWNTRFWSHVFYDWDEIVIPDLRSEYFDENHLTHQTMALDYARFNSDSLLHNYKQEYQILKSLMPHTPITTNLMGSYKTLDYHQWAKFMDFISWDSYPANEDDQAAIAFRHDLMRGLKQGLPFVLMEQTPGVSNWLPSNKLKRPGVLRLQNYQAMAHGADALLFFQMRQNLAGCEKFHSAVISHAGHEDTRTFRDVQRLGAELSQLGNQTLGGRYAAKAAILFDWNNWWAIENSAGPNERLNYLQEILNYYRALYELNITVDMISVEDDFKDYALIIAPLLYMIKPNLPSKLVNFVKQGGHFITTFFSGIVDENDHVKPGGYPGQLRELLGLWVEETDSLPKNEYNHFMFNGKVYKAGLLCDLLHPEGAKTISTYEDDFYKGFPVITCNQFGKGKAYYVAAQSEPEFYKSFLSSCCETAKISPLVQVIEGKIEVTCRKNGQTACYYLINHQDGDAIVTLPFDGVDLFSEKQVKKDDHLTIDAKEVMIIKYENNEHHSK